MSLVNLQRINSRRLRSCLALLALIFALGTIAHAGHVHSAKEQIAHHQVCDYCVSFAHLGATPTYATAQTVEMFFDEAPTVFRVVAAYVVTHTVAQARAPPR